MATRTASPNDVLNHWRLIELFSPQSVPREAPSGTPRVADVQPQDPLPWFTLPEPKETSSGVARVWQHTVYLGVYAISDIYEVLHRCFPADADAYDPRPLGESACAALVVDESRRLILDSAVCSTAAWALGRIANSPSPDLSPDAFRRAQADFVAGIDALLGSVKDERNASEALPVDAEILQGLLDQAVRATGTGDLERIRVPKIRIKSQLVRQKDAGDLPSFDFLNSFYLEELETVSESEWSAPLRHLLTPTEQLDKASRVDVVADPGALLEWLHPAYLRSGRWPSRVEEPLASSQQFAVNFALFGAASQPGVVPVNGPPGTGKTTMLRDLVAANVTQRGSALSELPHPNDAFTGRKFTFNTDQYRQTVRQLDASLTGFEMVVASSNNGAVENISEELPQASSIAERWRSDANYFKDLATRCLNSTQGGDSTPPVESWGLIAAKLGRKSYRGDFRSNVWFSDRHHDLPGLDALLKTWEDGVDVPSWSDARRDFQAAQKKVDDLVSLAVAAQSRIARVAELQAEIVALQSEGERLQAALHEAQRAESATVEQCATARQAHEERAAAYERQLHLKPSWLENLGTFGKAGSRWRDSLTPLSNALGEAEATLGSVRDQLHRAQGNQRSLADRSSQVGERLDSRVSELDRLAKDVENDRRTFGRHYPDDDWLQDNYRREQHAPWQTEELNEARSELFLSALSLHVAFLANARVRRDLRAAMFVVAGDAPADLDEQARLAAWQLFFLAVPVASSTFASLGRMFQGVGPESLGWFLIDEAGQASPSAAVGALWRAQRAVVVGDPMQLEPVVSVPVRAEHDIAARHPVSPAWFVTEQSLQKLADRVTRFGTELTQGPERLWVASPLRIHRRCGDPMFTISNTIAYEGMMIHGFSGKPSAVDGLPPTRWLHVPASDTGSHLQRAEVGVLRREIDRVCAVEGLSPQDIIAISPFRAVASELQKLEEDYPGLVSGTVHRAQGKEAAVVFFVLGGDTSKPGARQWAAAKPNLLNVAASRAKRRLYVIGDRTAWRTLPHFSTADALLAHTDTQEERDLGEGRT